MSDDPRALEPCRLWLAIGGILAASNKKNGKPPDLRTLPISIVTPASVSRVTQRLSGGSGTQLSYSLELFFDKPPRAAVLYRGTTLLQSGLWGEDAAGVHAGLSSSGKSLDFTAYLDGRPAAVQRILVESPFMKHAHPFGLEAKVSTITYGWHRDGGMTSTIEGEWRGSDEDDFARRERMGFSLYNDREQRALSAEEVDAFGTSNKRVPAELNWRDHERDALMMMRGAVTLEVRYGVAARPTIRNRSR